jgi:hypothetical protein
MASSVIKSGFFIERMVARLLTVDGYASAAEEFTTPQLIKLLEVHAPKRLKAVLEHKPNLAKAEPNQVIDWAFGLDYILLLPSGEKVGLDLTLNGEAVEGKTSKLKKLAKLWGALGVTHVATICYTLPQACPEGLQFYSAQDIVDDTFGVVYDVLEAAPGVHVGHVEIKRK